MRNERHSDGLWHAVIDVDSLTTVCGQPRSVPKRGRPGTLSCPVCIDARPANAPPTPTDAAPAHPDDPAVRADGLCALASCRKPRRPERSKAYGGIEAERDPFCSSECCKKFYGVVYRLVGDLGVDEGVAA